MLANKPRQGDRKQTRVTIFFMETTPTAERPLGDTEQLGGFDLIEPVGFMAIQITPDFDHACTLSGFRPAYPRSPKRSVSPAKARNSDKGMTLRW